MTLNDKVQVGDSTTSTSTNTTWRCPYTQPKAEQGWECPRCGRINAPWVRQCDCSRNDKWEKWDITWNRDDCAKPWWYDYKVTCQGTSPSIQLDSDILKVHPDTVTWKAPSSVCQSDSSTVKSNPNSTTYVTGHSSVVGGSDYWDEVNKTWTNIPNVSNNLKEIK